MKRSLSIACLCALFSGCSLGQTDTLEFRKDAADTGETALSQLQHFPSPRYAQHHTIQRLFNWMDPIYLGGSGQPGTSEQAAAEAATSMQEELSLHWNYSLVLHNTAVINSAKAIANPAHRFYSLIRFANQHPEIPFGVVTFWVQGRPKHIGRPERTALINGKFSERAYYNASMVNGKTKRYLRFDIPDSVCIIDGSIQRHYFEALMSVLTRPVNSISENGEEPPGAYSPKALMQDSFSVADKNRHGIRSWPEYMASKKLHFRKLYASQFLDSIPVLKNTRFSFYQVDGGPIDRFDWNTMKKIQTPVNGCYYSTFDFYPRWPRNWRMNAGPWHGWAWVDDARKTEIAAGDRFCSPFISPGWDYNEASTMRPAQWLGLLKCLTVVGAEYFYVGYFNVKKPVSLPQNYIWQAAIPSYAQAIVSRHEDFFRHSNVPFDKKGKPLITYLSNDSLLVTVRKHDSLPVYMLALTLQPRTNKPAGFPESRAVNVSVEGKTFCFNARRQGSVYLLDLRGNQVVCQWLDAWHERTHPQRWSTTYSLEAEEIDSLSPLAEPKLYTTNIKTQAAVTDLTTMQTYLRLEEGATATYQINERDSVAATNAVLDIELDAGTEADVVVMLNGHAVTRRLRAHTNLLSMPLREFKLGSEPIRHLQIRLDKGRQIGINRMKFHP